MFEVETLENGIVKISHEGLFDLSYWEEYKRKIVEILDESDEPVYILSDFSNTEKFTPDIVPQAGTAPHLTHPNLGLIVLLGGNALQNFVLQLTSNRARKDSRGSKMRVHWEYKRAMQTLEHFKNLNDASTSN